jgi:hypothetical protein
LASAHAAQSAESVSYKVMPDTSVKNEAGQNLSRTTEEDTRLLAQLDPDAALRTMGLRNRLTGVAKAAAYRHNPADQRAHDLMRNLLLILAYEQDAVLRKMLKRKDYANAMIFGASIGVFGVNLSQHLYAYHLAYHKPVPDGYHEIKIRAQTLVNMALIEDGIELFSAALVAGWSAYYSRKVNRRKKWINNQVDAVLNDLEQGANDTYAKIALLDLLKNEESAVEFLNIWRAAHASPGQEHTPLAEQDLFGRKIRRVQF